MSEGLPYISNRNDQLIELIAALDRSSLRPVSVFFQELATAIGDRATMHDIAVRRSKESAIVLGMLDGLGQVVEVLLSQGRSLDEITRQMEAEGIPPDTTLYYWKRHLKRQARAARFNRDREIMRLAAKGWRNTDIAGRVGLHPKSISRIIRRQLKRSA